MSNINYPAFLYFGGKWRVASWIVKNLPRHRVYVEPFGGAASVLLRKEPSKVEIYNDINRNLYDFFKTLQDPDRRARLIERLSLTPYSRDEYEDAWANVSEDSVDRAHAFVIKQQMSVSNAPERKITGFENRKAPKSLFSYPAQWALYVENLTRIADRLRDVLIENKDAFECIARYDHPETLFFCDPPYMARVRKSSMGHYKDFEMSDEDHVRLASVLGDIAGVAVVNGYRCDLYDELYSCWIRVDKETIGNFSKRHVESLWISPKAARPARLF
jgi:DNA adenine methylase